jgi:hypothetical protein
MERRRLLAKTCSRRCLASNPQGLNVLILAFQEFEIQNAKVAVLTKTKRTL